MKFSINKKDFVHYVQHVSMIVPTKATLQVISNLLIECSEISNSVKLTATDLNITVTVEIPANVLESGSICISSKNFSDIVTAMPDAMIHLSTNEDKLKIDCENSNFNLNYIDSSLYPIVPPIDKEKAIKFDKNIFTKMVTNTTFAAGSDSSNQIYSGIYWALFNNEQTMAATDSKRIAEVKSFVDINLEEPVEVVLPVKSLQFLEKFLTDNDNNEIEIVFEDKRVVYFYNNVMVISNKLEGKYPIYSVVFKKEHEHMMIIDKSFLKDAIKRVSLLGTQDDKNIMRFDINQDQITLEAINSELGNAKEVINEFTYDGEPITFGLNSRFVLSFLNVIDSDEVVFKIGKSTEPVWVLNNSNDEALKIRFVVMPLRLE